MSKLVRAATGTFMALAMIAGIAALSARPVSARFICECADLDAPVKCKGGKIYSNMCVASCFGATQCVPYGGGGIN